MRIVPIASITDGMQLAQDIPNPSPGGAPLLRAGVTLSDRLAARLAASSIRAVWISDELGEGIEPVAPLPDNVRQRTEVAHAKYVQAACQMLAASTGIPDAVLRELEQAVLSVTAALKDCPEVALAFDDLSSADNYSHSHAIRTTTLGVLLGQRIARLDGWIDWQQNRRFHLNEERVMALAMGLLIHDIGKTTLPKELLARPGKLTDDEAELVRTHPQAGAAMLPATRVHPLSIGIVRGHHERVDGLGYPFGKQGEEIHQFARIAAVANVYDNVTAERPGQRAKAPHVGVRAITQGAGTEFDQMVVKHFSQLVMPYPVGHPVALPDGRPAVVAGVSPEDPERPVVRYRSPDGRLIESVMHIVDGLVLDGYEPGSRERLAA